jgi:opacity protein-like surface antigen
MKRELLIAIILLVSIPALAQADPSRRGPARQNFIQQGPYVSAFLGVSALQNADLDTSGYDWDYDVYYDYKDKVEFDPGIFVGGTAGYDFGIVRLEGELSYKYNEIDTINGRSPGYYYLEDEVGTFAFMANMFIDLHNDSPVTPYFGGGIGFATISITNDVYDDYYYYEDETDDDSVFAYQLGGGVEIALNRNLSLDVGYRYFATDTAKFDVNTYYISQTSKIKLESHNVAVGLRFKF